MARSTCFFWSAGHKIQLDIKGVEFEKIAMRFAGCGTRMTGWAWAKH